MVSRAALLAIWLLLLVAAVVVLARMLWAILMGNAPRAWQIAIAFDGLANVAANGALGQTISARAAQSCPKRWARGLCWLLGKIDPGHCARAATAKDQNLT
jgi:hypothetical protein